jgi:hypothetical protein
MSVITPSPCRAAVEGLPLPSCTTFSCALLAPVDWGVNVTDKLQVPLGISVADAQDPLLSWNSDAFAPVIASDEIVCVLLSSFLSVTAMDPLVTDSGMDPKTMGVDGERNTMS